jgi:hypothetical protein
MTSAQAGNSGQAVAIKGNGNQAYQNSGSGSITVNQYAETKSDTDLTGNRIFDLTSKADKNEKGETYVHGAVKVKWSPRPGEEYYTVCLYDEANPCRQDSSMPPYQGTESYQYSITEDTYGSPLTARIMVRACLADQSRILAFYRLSAQKQAESLEPKCATISLDRPK